MLTAAWIVLGAALGAGVVALAARWQVRRSLARARLAERRAVAAQRLAELGAMTGGLAHEIKNPLSTIGLNAQLLGEGIDDLPTDRPIAGEEKQRLSRRLASLRRETERLRGILTDFLTYAGELRLDAKPTDVNVVVDELADFFEAQAAQQGVRMRVDLAPGPVMARVDAGLVKQALLNLALNAVQAMGGAGGAGGAGGSGGSGGGAGGTNGVGKELMLRTGRGVDADRTGTVEVRVIDTGPGMTEEVRSRLFTPYFTTKAGGSGLGLATTRRIVDAHGGRIEVHSEPGRGTVFTLVFPAEGGGNAGA